MKTESIQVPETYEDFESMVMSKSAFGINWLGISGEIRNEWIRKFFENKKNHGYAPYTFNTLISYKFRLLGHMTDPDIPRYPDKKIEGMSPYPCIPLSPVEFLEVLVQAKKLIKKDIRIKFIDAGCGVGDKVKLAEGIFGLYAHGVEYSNVIYQVAKERLNGYGYITKGDIRKFNFSGYDIIYSYNPMQDVEGMYEFFQNVARTADIGTVCVFVNVYSGDDALDKLDQDCKYFKEVAKDIYILNKRLEIK